MVKRSLSRERIGAIALILALAAVPLSFAGGQPEGRTYYGPGMMGRAQGGAYGYSMMGGGQGGAYGYGMMGGGQGGAYGYGMMGGGFYGMDNSLQRSVDIKKAQSIVTDYLATTGNKNLIIDETMEFENNLYVLIKESDTGKGAFELLVDPFTGAVRPEFGPNMMWNLKYGMMGGRAGAARANTISAEEAKKLATDYLDRVRGHGPYELAADEFYGYYTLDVKKDGAVLGMLSVNAFSGQVWYHSWHGGYIGMQEGVAKM